MIDGRPVRAVGYQSGAVRPEFRGKGLYRDLMRRAFAWAETQDFELGILLTDKPALYEPYGFRALPQHVFRGPAPAGTSRPTARVLNMEDGGDIALIRRLLPARQPVSSLFAVTGHWIEFPLNACFDSTIRLSHIPGLDAIVAWRSGEGAFELLDIVACEIPPFGAVVGALGIEQSPIAVHFPPDRLEWKSYQPEAYRSACDLMIRPMRPVKMPDGPFALPPTAEF